MEARLEDAATEWVAAGRDPGFLLGGSRLTLFASWAQATDLRLDTLGRELLEASLAERRRAESTERERDDRQRRLERRAATGLRALVAVLLVAVLVTSGLLAVVWRQGEVAREDRAIATARELAVASNGALDADPVLALLLAVESARATADRGWIVEEALDALHWALQAARVPYPSFDEPVAVRTGPDGARGVYLVSAGDLVRRAAEGAGRTLTTEECRSYLHADGCPPADVGWADPGLAVRTAAGPVAAADLAAASLAGTRVRVASQLPTDLAALLGGFSNATGIAVDVVRADDVAPAAGVADLAILARPDDVATLARSGRLLDLRTVADPAPIEAALGASVTRPGWVGPRGTGPDADAAGLYGIPLAVSISSLLWYPVDAFRAAGYEPPGTWSELEALIAEIIADGRTPWCLGVGGDPATAGSPGPPMRAGEDLADWVEDLLLLGPSGDPQYELWAEAKLSFQDRSLAEALERLDALVRPAGAVLRGIDAGLLIPHAWAALPMAIGGAPGCWLQHGAATLRSSWPVAQRGRMGAVPLPVSDEERAGLLRGRGYTLVVLRDRPEVRALVGRLLDGTFATELARTASLDGLVPVTEVDPTSFPGSLERAWYGLLRRALPDGFALDATDQMPASVGAQALPDGLVRYLATGDDRRAAALEEVLADLELARARSR
jgi:alpha-glucoside transport system substrate-binding protein